jgi:carbon-monoxide dehydrogenase large subunit
MTVSASGSTGIGQPVRRKEDIRLVTGGGCYSDDYSLPGQAHAAFVRSPHAHAKIVEFDLTPALAVPGVIAILTGSDAAADGLRPIPHNVSLGHAPDIILVNQLGSGIFVAPHLPLPPERARFVGEAVAMAMVIGECLDAARDAAERVIVRYEVLPAVTDSREAAAAGAPRLWDEIASNVFVDADVGDRAAAAAAFAKAAHVVRLQTWIQRITGVPMEPRAALGQYDPATGRYTLYAGSGGPVRQKRELAHVLGVPETSVRVVARDVGGNFGTRNNFYPEFALVAWASRRVGRAVKWTCERGESFLSDHQGRDLFVEAELALDEDGRFLGIRGSNLSNVGAYVGSVSPLRKGLSLMSSVYRIPAAHFRGRAVYSNTPPSVPYRSAGRPEAMFVIERLIDIAAATCGFDRVALRKKNLIPASTMPFANPLGLTYDNGDYRQAMDRCLQLAEWDGFVARRRDARSRGKLRGIGLANYIEVTSGDPRERAEITVRPDGRVEMVIGTMSSGQGHETSFAQLLTEWLGVPLESVHLITGDTDRVAIGGGSHSGRSMRLASVVIARASDEILAKARRIAAQVLEVGENDIEFNAGRFEVKGTDRGLGLFEIATAARERNDLAPELQGPLSGIGDETIRAGGFPYGSQVCEVEIDPHTGAVEIVRYAALDDVGRAINPLILHGQTHGGIAQGVGQALLELCHYDSRSGQLLSASFLDYAMPRADVLPSFATGLSEVASPTNPLGIRAGGEGGTTPALAAVINAVVDALAALGVTHVEMPATPDRVWQTIRDAQHSAAVRQRLQVAGH